jgi:hypothetical protein
MRYTQNETIDTDCDTFEEGKKGKYRKYSFEYKY